MHKNMSLSIWKNATSIQDLIGPLRMIEDTGPIRNTIVLCVCLQFANLLSCQILNKRFFELHLQLKILHLSS